MIDVITISTVFGQITTLQSNFLSINTEPNTNERNLQNLSVSFDFIRYEHLKLQCDMLDNIKNLKLAEDKLRQIIATGKLLFDGYYPKFEKAINDIQSILLELAVLDSKEYHKILENHPLLSKFKPQTTTT